MIFKNANRVFANFVAVMTSRSRVPAIAVITLCILGIQDTMAQADTLAGAKYDLVDRFGVNMASGQVQVEQITLSIGGPMGLTHKIASQASDFVNIAGLGGGFPTAYGFGDAHRGGLYTLALYKEGIWSQHWKFGVRVFGGGTSADFVLDTNGNFVPYTVPSKDTLEFEDGPGFTGYVFTTGDGTRMYYPGARITYIGVNTFLRWPITKIVYPNNFTVEINLGPSIDGSIRSVRTNAGFQLKYDFTGSWNGSSPTRVTALNNRYERCPFLTSSCSPSSQWPYATFTWPVGEPDGSNSASLHVNSIFRVRDGEGRITEYHHSPHQADVGPIHPRLVKIKKDGTTIRNYEYEFLQFLHSSSSNHSIIQSTGIATVDVASAPGGGSNGYTMHIAKYMYGSHIGNINSGSGLGSVNFVESSNYGALVQIDSVEQHIDFYYALLYDAQVVGNQRVHNWIEAVRNKRGNIITTFQYDDRGNVTERTENGVSFQADYPATCTSANFKYCNKPTWIDDRKGNRTDFTYHPQSGQIASRTLPTDSDGIRPKTVYEYDQYYAHYKIDSETIEAAEAPIWLLTSETSCQNSTMNSNGTCAGNDAVTTSYQYDYYNLYVRGVAVTAKNTQGVMETRRTCYEYDKYGNRVGETSPRANLTTCL